MHAKTIPHANYTHAEVQRLHTEGFSLVPLQGKRPLMHFADRGNLPVDAVIDTMVQKKSYTYGVRLSGLVVLDVDEPNHQIVEELQKRFGPCSVIVETSRGHHLYYRHLGGTLPNLKREGLPVDVKTGANQYVVGPGSVRPDGTEYRSIKAPLSWNNLTEIRNLPNIVGVSPKLDHSKPSPRTTDGKVPEGQRHDHLVKAAKEMVANVPSPDELYKKLAHERDEACLNPQTCSDNELREIASWAWQKRLGNSIFSDRRSEVRVRRDALDLIEGETAPTALYTILCSIHGHIAGKTFVLDHDGMKDAGKTDLSRDAFRKTVKRLIEVGLLEVAQEYKVGQRKRTYRLAMPHRSNQNLQQLPSPKPRQRV